MKADTVYTFTKHPTTKETYLLQSKYGADIPDVLTKYVRTEYAGKQYVIFAETREQKTGGRKWTHSFYVLIGSGKERVKKRISGVNFTPENPHKTYGDYGNDAILIDFSPDMQTLTMFFFKGLKLEAQALFERWTAGEIPDMPESHAVPLPLGKEKADIGGTSA